MAAKKPLVSVLMTFYDDGLERTRKHFSCAFSSVLSQSCRDFEIVLYVSGRKDFAQKMASKSRRVRLFFYEKRGVDYRTRTLQQRVFELNTTRNLCVEKAKGEYLMLMDCDDISLPGRMAEQLAFMRKHPEIGVVGSSMLLIDETGKGIGMRRAVESDVRIRKSMLCFNPVPQPTVFARKELVVKAGGYDPEEIAEDFDLWVRLAKITKFHNLAKPVLKYRVHASAAASKYKMPLYLGSLRVKMKAARELGLSPSLADVAVNAAQFASLFFPDCLRRTLLEKARSEMLTK